MGFGPLNGYVPPGVYTRTLTSVNASNLTAGLRIPVFIGIGQESLENDNVEIIRGSSSDVDVQIVNEDVTSEWVVDSTNPQNLILGVQNGTFITFQVKNFPITDGQGTGTISNDPKSVIVTVNGIVVAVGSVTGKTGLVSLQVPTQPTDVVRVTYSFHRGDFQFTDNVSQQVTTTQAILITPAVEPFVVVAGQSDQLLLTVNGTAAAISLGAQSYTAAGLVSAINAVAVANLVASVSTDASGLNHVQLLTTQNLVVGSGTMNGILGFSAGTQTNRNQAFQVFQRPVVDGSGGGVTTTDTSKVVVKVNGTQVVPTSLDGTNGIVTLGFAPAAGTTVTVTYFANTWQDTFDYLPNSQVTSVLQCGIAVGRNDFINGTDFIISNPSPDVSVVFWGAAFVVTAGSTSQGGQPFDNTLITGLLVDDQIFLGFCTRVTNTQTIPATVSPNQILLPQVPTTGNGRNTPLGSALFASVTNSRQDLVTDRPDLVTVRVGRSFRDALGRAPAVVTAVDGPNRLVTLRDPLPPDYKAFATFWYSRIEDDTFVLTCTVGGSLGVGQYTLLDSANNASLYNTRFGTKSGLSETVQWPRGVENIPDTFHTGSGKPVSETVTVTFGNAPANNASFTNRNPEPYNFFSPSSATWGSIINGSNVSTNLATAARGVIVSNRVPVIQSGADTGKITIQSAPSNVLNLVIDGTAVAVNLPTGNQTPTAIVGAINTAIDAASAFSGTAPNNLAHFSQVGSSTGDVYFWISSFSTPSSLPAGFDTVSEVSIAQGTAETQIGFKTFQLAMGTPGAINKPATVLGSLAGPFNITAGVNDQLLVTINGVLYTITLPSGSTVATSALVTAINATPGLSGVASNGTGANSGKLRLTSPTNNTNSSIQLGVGTSNSTLGFSNNQFASQTRVFAQEVVNELMATSGFISGAIAFVDNLNSLNYITIASLTVGAAASSIGFAVTSNSAFNPTTNIGLTPGTDGDNGEDSINNFTVTSSNPSGSAGFGFPGQTYVDTVTGLRFTVLPSKTGTYDSGGSFTLVVSQTFNVNPSVPHYAIPGLETTVSNTVGVAVGDTGTVQTFAPSGTAPSVGDAYYISYLYQKQDFSTRLFQQTKTIEANFGPVAPQNFVSLAAFLGITNGAVLVGISQVLKAPNTNQATDSSFITAIEGLATPLPGGVHPDILVPLATTTTVYSFLTNHCETLSGERFQSERMGFIGFASGTSPNNASAVARGLASNRIVAFYPDSVVITLTDATGQSFDSTVDGIFFPAGAAGAVCSPSIDVATPYTRRRLQGYTSIPRTLDLITANQTAVSGVTLVEFVNPSVRIRDGLTTNMTNVLTRLPTVTQISDFVEIQSRATTDAFIGTKFLSSRANDVVVSMTALFKGLIQAEIIAAFTGLTASTDPNDPTMLDFGAYYQPIFPLQYISVTLNLRSSLSS